MSYESIFDQSYERVVKKTVNGESFFSAFYRNFVASSPEIRQKFANTDMEKQQKMLKKSFYSLLVFYGSGSVDEVLEKIAESHSAKALNIKPEFYDLWLRALVETLPVYDEHFSDDVELAWRLVLSGGITYMKFKYAR